MTYYTKPDVIKALRVFCGKFETAALAAKTMKVTPAQLSLTLNGKKPVIPARILKKLGFAEKTVYVATGKVATAPTAKPKRVRKQSRSAGSGEFVSQAVADANPDTTVTESVRYEQTPADGGVVIDVRSTD